MTLPPWHSPSRQGGESVVVDGQEGHWSVRNGSSGQGSNSANVRVFNERVILTALRKLGRASKADLARHANLTSNTAGLIVRELEDQKLVRVEGKRTGMRGQPATVLSLNAEGAYAIGIKVGRRSVDAILVDFCGSVIERRRHERAFPLPEEAMALVRDDVGDLRQRIPPSGAGRLAGLGVATPYNMGSWRRELDISSAAYAAWNDFDIAARLADETGLLVLHENDGTAAAVAELFTGHGRELDDFLYVFVGTAIGGGVIVGGQYHRGVHGNAGDIGLMPVLPSHLASAPQPDGRYDILLTRASISSLIRHLQASGVPIASRGDLDQALAGAGAALLDDWLADCVDALVAPLLSAARVLDIDAIVLEGDLPRPVLEELAGRLVSALEEASPEARRAPELRLGTVGRWAAAIGAAILPLHLNFCPSSEILMGH